MTNFKKSSFCVIAACVQVANMGSTIFILQSENPKIMISVSKEEWRAFVAGVKNGEFDFES